MGIRRSSRSIEVFVNVGDVLGELTDEELVEELKSRRIDDPNLLGCDRSDAEHAIDLMRSRHFKDALTLLERALYPKFQSRDACASAIAEIRLRASHR
ncbi:hypothetical protein [Methylobacterium haplocladii]|uniref:Uncharacterized protein n=1 Tax=Methylobacterium haplocladii TaxID=1176176 RepID=A0A512ISB0_9HYPH|nr:hypothetical protein [Methylobacterium haplocladii]GEP00573.1 hypothetical protein MHA02_29600 [Methylobacterium haplocladii]GJD85488.1 hypothetical protein HPGCJGGD_3377 [Methylobacterium haplocladii]GLS57721.1 hypothetical protein GCM10007887_03770 [Methylobacterium haplocladii]